MRYKLDLSPKFNVLAPSITGAPDVGRPQAPKFIAWQTSTWPPAPATVEEQFVITLKQIFEESILGEIANVISDAQADNGNLEHRGHVVGIALLCALDAISSYGYGARSGKQIPEFIRAHFPAPYHRHADSLLTLYRHSMIHSWNLFEVALTPGNEQIRKTGNVLTFGLLNFFEALSIAAGEFLEQLAVDSGLQRKALQRYQQLRSTAKP